MSGVEAAGLVLGSIPLILAGLEFYAKGIAVTRRYVKYKEEYKTLRNELGTEHVLFVNTIELLLFGLVKPTTLKEMLNEPGGERWKDEDFERKLKERLGEGYEAYINTVNQMNETSNVFRQRLKLGVSGKPQFTEEKAFKEHYKRLKFSVHKADYDDLMAKLRRANYSLLQLTTQTRRLETLQNRRKQDSQNMPNFSVIHDHAQGFHSALRSGWKCPCHADHSVNLRLEPRIEDVSSDDDDNEEESMKDPFHVVFCYSHRHHHHHHPYPKHHTSATDMPWSWEEASVRITREQETPVTTQPCSRTGKKGVRFAHKAKKAVQAALDPVPDIQPIQDLCTAISTLQKPQRDVCLSLLANEYAKQKYGIHIYPLKDPPSNPELWTVLTLRKVLQDTKFTRQDRLRLAVTLASSVLQLHETPWLGENWSKDNIFFINRSDKTIYDHPFVSQHFNQPDPASQNRVPSSISRIIRNQTLFALGVSLIELWYGKALQELHKSEDGACDTGDPRIDLMTEYCTADRVVDELYSEAGAKYSDAVRRCVRCQFDSRASSLDDLSFQKAVFDGVVAQLKENYEFMKG
ncbi:hypothetical protein BDV96DRAFT_627668 [Lophiotrema nucula]|uniref:DUF7580 domain-containing protein n=1 Tax=Lophiotrema nucula TaxID=690887 RepID=A0A6A5ZPC9_9PLEO|nr:hypothetical protein BDV96DRAFT_627668 [Lophiotrema nucula]